MSTSTTIEWTQRTWNPVTGCTKVSAGCANCYAEKMSARLAGFARSRIENGGDPGGFGPYLHVINNGRWKGNVYLNRRVVHDPFRWCKPSVVFVNSMSDLFHEDVPDDFIAEVFGVMNRCPLHTFQVLTKRPERAAALSRRLDWTANIWMGTSVENAHVLDRIDHLRRADAAVRFLSVEPLLGPLPKLPLPGIDWVIVGGESGPGARPMAVDWAREIRDRCLATGTPFFFKQFGVLSNNPDLQDPTAKENGGKTKGGCRLDGLVWHQMPPTSYRRAA